MTEQEIKDLVKAKIDARAVEFNALKDQFSQLVDDMLVDLKDVIVAIPDFKTFKNIIVDEIDDRTNTGIFDIADGLIAKMAIDAIAKANGLEEKFQSLKKQAETQIGGITNG
jgi:hypothetical protein